MTSFLKKNKIFSVYILFWTVYFTFVWGRALYFDQASNLVARHVGVWGDWAVHLTMGSAMAFRDLFLTTSPLLSGAPFRYPFFVNFVSALLIRAGVPILTSFTVPSFLFCLLFTAGLFLFYRLIFRSDVVALAGCCIFLFNGGWGFVYFIKDVLLSATPIKTLFYPPETYTNMEPFLIKWTSVVDTMIIPQRAFQLGFPVGLAVLALLTRFLKKPIDANTGEMFDKDEAFELLLAGFL